MSAPDSPKPRPGALDWALTVPFWIGFGATLLVFDVAQRVARLFGPRPHEVVAGALQSSLVAVFHLSGMRLEVERAPEVKPRTPYILIANHQSMFDIPIFGAKLFTNYPKYVSKRSLARWIPSISYNLRRGGNGLIDRGDRKQAQEEIRRIGALAQQRGVSVVIYPEGTRARRGELGAFKPGGTLALLEAAPELEVVPCVIDDAWRLLRWNLMPVPAGVRVRVRFAAPIAREGRDGMEMLALAREEIEKTLARWRAEPGRG